MMSRQVQPADFFSLVCWQEISELRSQVGKLKRQINKTEDQLKKVEKAQKKQEVPMPPTSSKENKSQPLAPVNGKSKEWCTCPESYVSTF